MIWMKCETFCEPKLWKRNSNKHAMRTQNAFRTKGIPINFDTFVCAELITECASHLRALWIPSNQNHDVLINVVVFFIITDYIFRWKIVTSIRHTHWLSHNGIWMIISKSNYACIESEVSSSVLLLPTAPNIQMIKHTSIWMTVWQNVFILWIKDFYAHKEHDTLAQWGWNDNKSRTAVHRSFVK